MNDFIYLLKLMLSRSLVLRQLVRFCTKNQATSAPVEKVNPEFLAEAERKQSLEIPVHLRPYNAAKYEVPVKKIKKNSGYAMIQIEPFPRARIMKICYNILADIRKDIPEDYIFRILIEERTKFIMEVVDREDDTHSLQNLLGRIPIEIFIRNLADTFELISAVRQLKPWELEGEAKIQAEQSFMAEHANLKTDKNPQYKKSERTKSSML